MEVSKLVIGGAKYANLGAKQQDAVRTLVMASVGQGSDLSKFGNLDCFEAGHTIAPFGEKSKHARKRMAKILQNIKEFSRRFDDGKAFTSDIKNGILKTPIFGEDVLTAAPVIKRQGLVPRVPLPVSGKDAIRVEFTHGIEAAKKVLAEMPNNLYQGLVPRRPYN